MIIDLDAALLESKRVHQHFGTRESVMHIAVKHKCDAALEGPCLITHLDLHDGPGDGSELAPLEHDIHAALLAAKATVKRAGGYEFRAHLSDGSHVHITFLDLKREHACNEAN